MEFTGFPVAALDFYDDLEVDNTKSFWEKHKHVYEESVKAPMVALCDARRKEFGDAKVFRPYRDVRFAKDKTPYKTHQGAFVAGRRDRLVRRAAPPAYSSAAASTVRRRRDWTDARRDRPRHLRRRLEKIVRALDRKRFDDRRRRAEDNAARVRRGPPAHRPAAAQVDHREPDHRLRAGDPHPKLLDLVRKDWRATRPLVEWVSGTGRTDG